jgi:hypothetical protein
VSARICSDSTRKTERSGAYVLVSLCPNRSEYRSD